MKWLNKLTPKPKRHEKEEELFPFREFLAIGNELIGWSNAIDPPVYNVEWVTPSIYSPRTGVWVFCEHHSGLDKWSNTQRAEIEAECIRLLRRHQYPEGLINGIGFVFDSHENVVEHYEGNYGYRLKG